MQCKYVLVALSSHAWKVVTRSDADGMAAGQAGPLILSGGGGVLYSEMQQVHVLHSRGYKQWVERTQF